MDSSPPPPQQMHIVNVHTPKTSYSIVHALQQNTFQELSAKLAKKEDVGVEQVGNGWIKYEWNDDVWNLDDDSDYAIFVWRFTKGPDPTLHVRDPNITLTPLSAGEYVNHSYYAYKPAPLPAAVSSSSIKSKSKSRRSVRSMPNGKARSGIGDPLEEEGTPVHKKDFEKFHSENGVRTVIGQIGPVKGVRMLLKAGYKHVYISRVFAAKHGFIPKDAVPGHYGYGGIVQIGKFPVTLLPGPVTTEHTIYLTEESHFDVVLGRSFIEKRMVKFDGTDQTNVICRDTGAKLDVEVVVLRDGRGEVVTVT